ncbi:MAG: hypothetical protein ACYCZN_02050 [Candidatus Dormibacteria bacterium]
MSNATGSSSSGFFLVGIVALLLIFFFIVLPAAMLAGALLSIIPWAWAVWRDERHDPDRPIYWLLAWIRAQCRYPFLGLGSAVAFVAGALAIVWIADRTYVVWGMAILALIAARAISMAWFPPEPWCPRGVRAYPLAPAAALISTGLGLLAILVLGHGGAMLASPHVSQGLALSTAPAAVALLLLAATVRRLGWAFSPPRLRERLAPAEVLTEENVVIAQDLSLRSKPELGWTPHIPPPARPIPSTVAICNSLWRGQHSA